MPFDINEEKGAKSKGNNYKDGRYEPEAEGYRKKDVFNSSTLVFFPLSKNISLIIFNDNFNYT